MIKLKCFQKVPTRLVAVLVESVPSASPGAILTCESNIEEIGQGTAADSDGNQSLKVDEAIEWRWEPHGGPVHSIPDDPSSIHPRPMFAMWGPQLCVFIHQPAAAQCRFNHLVKGEYH